MKLSQGASYIWAAVEAVGALLWPYMRELRVIDELAVIAAVLVVLLVAHCALARASDPVRNGQRAASQWGNESAAQRAANQAYWNCSSDPAHVAYAQQMLQSPSSQRPQTPQRTQSPRATQRGVSLRGVLSRARSRKNSPQSG